MNYSAIGKQFVEDFAGREPRLTAIAAADADIPIIHGAAPVIRHDETETGAAYPAEDFGTALPLSAIRRGDIRHQRLGGPLTAM